MKKVILTSLLALTCAMGYAADPTYAPKDGYPRFALGADVSWTPYIEENHLHTYYRGYEAIDDQVTTIQAMVYDHGIDAVRLRVWVDPYNEMALSGFKFTVDGYNYEEMSTFGTCSIEEMTALAKRFAMQGQRVMVTFQLSDTWADPGRQFIPQSWAGCTTVQELSDKASAHIKQVLQLLHDSNVNVAWVQIGNETNTGMLKYELPSTTGETLTSVSYGCEISQKSANTPSSTTYNFVKVFTDASRSAKEVYPDTKVVLHLTKTSQWSTLNWTMNLLNRAGFSSDICDYIGLSLYPGIDDGQENYTAKWKTYADLGIATINNIYSTYGFRTLLCEIGMNNEYSLSANTTGVSGADLQKCYIDQCNTDVKAFTEYLIENLDTDDSTCDGLFYWEPETDYMKSYTKGACVSITPGPAWARDKVTANDWWKAVKEHSTFPAGGLVEYRVSEDTRPEFEPDPNLQLYLYYYDNEDQYMPLRTTDGRVYTLTGFAANQWFNFKVVSEDWSIALGNAEIGLGQEGFLNARNDWYAWTSTEVKELEYWWYRHDTHAMIVTGSDKCPWPGIIGGAVEIDCDENNAEKEYYTLQGIRTHNPTNGIFIVRQGSLITKTIIR